MPNRFVPNIIIITWRVFIFNKLLSLKFQTKITYANTHTHTHTHTIYIYIYTGLTTWFHYCIMKNFLQMNLIFFLSPPPLSLPSLYFFLPQSFPSTDSCSFSLSISLFSSSLLLFFFLSFFLSFFLLPYFSFFLSFFYFLLSIFSQFLSFATLSFSQLP